METVTGLIPPVTPEQMRQGILYIQQLLHSEGMTAVKDPDIEQIHWDAYKSLVDQGQLKEHICVLWHAGSTLESARKALAEINAVPRLPSSLGDDRLLSCGAKIYMDGSGGARAGWVYDDWLKNATTPDATSSGAGNRGYPQTDPAVYREMVRRYRCGTLEPTLSTTSGAFGAISLDFRVNQASQPTFTFSNFCKWSYDWINARIHAFLRVRRTAEASTQ